MSVLNNPYETVTDNRVKHVVIAGGGTAGWMCAAAMSKVLGSSCTVTLVESDQIGTVGVGEATIPEIAHYNRILGIDENEFIRYTQGTFKLGIEFVDWFKKGESYIHPFGDYGTTIDNLPFYHYWHKLSRMGRVPNIDSYCLAIQACRNHKFTRPVNIKNSPLNKIAYAYHFDAGLYAQFLRAFAEKRGVRRIEGKIAEVELEKQHGNISALHIHGHGVLHGDLFIDCTGFSSLLLGKALGVGYEDWSHYLPCNRAAAVGCERSGPLLPYTRSTARDAGWQWRIPLQSRTGNGYVYCSDFISDDEATETLLKSLDGRPLSEPRHLKFTTGRRKAFWEKNCIGMGLSSGFLEPLESTSIHLIQSAISKLLGLFPSLSGADCERRKFNKMLDDEFLGIRDFLILHYKATQREDTEFWTYCKNMKVPDSLAEKMALYRSGGRIYRDNGELFGEVSWLSVLLGQGIAPNDYNPLVDASAVDELVEKFQQIETVITNSCDAMPTHEAFIEKFCRMAN